MKKLTKSNNRIICGVCGGLAKYFGVDPTIVRLLMIIFTIFVGAGIILYIIAAIIMPSADINDEDISHLKRANQDYDDKTDSFNKKGHSDKDFNSFFDKK